jgi:hypothetical protein
MARQDTMEKLVGQELDFFGVDNYHFKLGEKVYEAQESEPDGYRSYLGSVEEASVEGLNFFHTPIARVRVLEAEENEEGRSMMGYGYKLVDVQDGHVWLLMGTQDDSSGYYPCFVFDYEPKQPK